MRSLITLLVAISSVYFGFNDVTVGVGAFINKSRTPTDTQVLSHHGSALVNEQSAHAVPQVHTLQAAPSDYSTAVPVEVEGLIGQSTNAAVISVHNPDMLKSYTVENLVGACAYNCAD